MTRNYRNLEGAKNRNSMYKFIGTKIILAEEMDELTFLETFKKDAPIEVKRENQPGYHVKYPNGYDSWSPKNVFESAYRKFTDGEVDLLSE